MFRKVGNPPSPFDSVHREFLDDIPDVKMEIFEEKARSIISENKSPDIGFQYSVNPYRGCFHACAYCYARPSHEYLGFGAGTDFESKIVVKTNAPQLLRAHFEKKSWKGGEIIFSGDTDCYQPLEAHYRLTRGCLEACLEYRNPASLITKSRLILRDIEILAELQRQASAHVCASIAFSEDGMARKVEPQTPSPSKRFEMIEALSKAGVPVTVLIAPVIPGLNDSQIAPILSRAAQAGAKWAAMTILRLPGNVREVFLNRMRNEFPDRMQKIESFIRNAKDGALNKSEFYDRFRGKGEYWEGIRQLFKIQCKKLGLNQTPREERSPSFKRPGDLFALGN